MGDDLDFGADWDLSSSSFGAGAAKRLGGEKLQGLLDKAVVLPAGAQAWCRVRAA
jgi:hypothetical protein